MAAVVVAGTSARSLTEALDQVVASAAIRHELELPLATELHGYHLFHGKDDWRPLAGRARARIGIYREALSAIAAHDAYLILRGVNKPGLAARRYADPWHPHKVVLQHALEDIDRLAEREDQPALVIADEIDGAIGYRRALWEYQRLSTTGYRPRTLVNIVDTLHFAPSNSSRLVQAADLIAFLYARMYSGIDRDPRAIQANQALWALVADRVYSAHCWKP